MSCGCEMSGGLGVATPPPHFPLPGAIPGMPIAIQGLGQASPAQDYVPDIVAGLAAFATPFAYTKYRKRKWPKASILGQLAMVGGTYFGVRYLFNIYTPKQEGLSGLGTLAWSQAY